MEVRQRERRAVGCCSLEITTEIDPSDLTKGGAALENGCLVKKLSDGRS
jgi:hypothetical protein